MAWIASATNNADLVSQLTELGVLKDQKLINAFRLTDRGDFVVPSHKSEAYFDRPFKRSFVHLSAPHMYATVLEKLDIKQGHAFLNVGSGSGYLSCLVACLLGKNGLSHGIDVNEEVVNHSRECTLRWFDRHKQLVKEQENSNNNSNMEIPEILEEGISFVHGNCFNIDIDAAAQTCRYDRIYIGAGCPDDKKEFFYSLLAENGLMILPVNNKNVLLKVIRKSRSVFASEDISNVNFAPLLESINIELKVKLPPVLWAPLKSRHQQYPLSFRNAVKTLLLSASRLPNYDSSFKHSPPFIPTHLWQYILTFTSRNWFIPNLTEVQCLTEDLAMERSMREDSEEKLKITAKKLKRVEQERDMYKMMMMRIRRVITNNPQTMRTQLVEMLNTGDLPMVANPIIHHNLEDSDDDDDDDDDGDDEEVDDEEEIEIDEEEHEDEEHEDDEEEHEDEEHEDEENEDQDEEHEDEEHEDEEHEDEEHEEHEDEEFEYSSMLDMIVDNKDHSHVSTNEVAQESSDHHMDVDQTYDTFDIKIDGWFIV